jgi:replication factor A1
MFFEKKGIELIGKTAETLRKQYDPTSIPPEISQWIGHKFTFIVKVLFKRSLRNIEPSFEVLMIKERHGKQATLPNTIQNLSNDELSNDDLPPLVTISSKKNIKQVCETKNYCLVHVLLHIFLLNIRLLQASSSYNPQFTDIQGMDIDHYQSE